jgi:manganese transport protein
MAEAQARQLTLTDRTIGIGLEALSGRCRGLRRLLPFVGPAVVASVAYMDPGNFATNIEAGAKYNYDLLWVVVLASIMAMFFQALSAKLGIATGRNLAELSREHFPRPIVWAMWVASEIAAMATDLAEFLGCAIGFSLLVGMPLLAGMVVTGIATFAILSLQRWGFRPIELLIGGLVALIGASYLIELLIVPPDWASIAFHSVVPRLDGVDALTLVVGHFRRHRNAARDLSPLGPDPGPHRRKKRHRAAQIDSLLEPRSCSCARPRRPRQYGHARNGGGRLSRRRAR